MNIFSLSNNFYQIINLIFLKQSWPYQFSSLQKYYTTKQKRTEVISAHFYYQKLTYFAEKTAIGTAVAQGHRNIVAVAIVTRDSGLPCGSCRQVLNEFGADMWCIMLNGAGEVTMEMPLTQVLPHAFGPKNLL
uniref:Cytidine deaminase n=1 Tax=Spironucleus salmonicida TaxID=348837 RepID=V6LEH9_9EUKA|eukprot:EST42892.1 Cytidine deaminase [Spironucleus salmonicida]